jgi:hypothetical protein
VKSRLLPTASSDVYSSDFLWQIGVDAIENSVIPVNIEADTFRLIQRTTVEKTIDSALAEVL